MSENPRPFKNELLNCLKEIFFLWLGFILFTITAIVFTLIAAMLGANKDVIEIVALTSGALAGIGLGFFSYNLVDRRR